MALLPESLSNDSGVMFVLGAAKPVSLAHCLQHVHPYFELVLHPSGRGHTTVGNGQRIAFAPGDAILYPPRERHDQQLSETGEDLIVQFECRSLAVDRTLAWHGVLRDRVLAIARLLADHPSDNAHHRHAASHLVLALLHGLDSAGTPALAPGAGHAAQARRLIAERYRELGRLEEVASALGLSHDHLRHLFREQYGMSLVGWLTDVRLARARELLARTPFSLAEVAAQVGWPSARYLCTVFRERMGTTPGTWRSRQAGGRLGQQP